MHLRVRHDCVDCPWSDGGPEPRRLEALASGEIATPYTYSYTLHTPTAYRLQVQLQRTGIRIQVLTTVVSVLSEYSVFLRARCYVTRQYSPTQYCIASSHYLSIQYSI